MLRRRSRSWANLCSYNSCVITAFITHRETPQEIAILGQLQHANVVQLLGGCLQPGSTFLVEELCGCSLATAIYSGEQRATRAARVRWGHAHVRCRPLTTTTLANRPAWSSCLC